MWACQDSCRSKVTPRNFVVDAGDMRLSWMNRSGFWGFFRDREKVGRVDLSARNFQIALFPPFLKFVEVWLENLLDSAWIIHCCGDCYIISAYV
jgi:hypothetical protein